MERQHIISTLTKCLSAIILLLAYSLSCLSQASITINFSGQLNGSAYQRLDSVKVNNISRGWAETVHYPDTIAILRQTNNTEEISFDTNALYQNVPNPFDCTTTAKLTISKTSDVTLMLVDVNGRTLTSYNGTLDAGIHKFEISAEKPQTYLLNALVGTKSYSIRMVNIGNGCGNAIKYLGESQDITAKLECLNEFRIGDIMSYTGYATIDGESITSTPITRAQNGSENITLNFSISIVYPIVSTLQATEISQTSASINGRVSCNCTLQATGFYYGTSTNSMTNNITTTQSPLGTFSYLLSELEQGTTYFYRAYAIYNDEIYTGEIKSFTTDSPNINHDITVTFTSRGHSTNYQYLYLYIPLDSVKIQDQNRNWEQTLIFPDTIMNVDFGNTKLNINGNASSGDRMTYTGYTSYRGVIYTQQTQRNLYSGTIEFMFEIPFCDDKYTYIEITDCEPITYNGITYTQSGQYEIGHFHTTYNCDSIIILDVNIGNYIFTEQRVETCDDSYTLNDITYTESGYYRQTLTSVHGCDSVISLNLILGNGFTDTRDGNIYCTLTIGNQVWMAENLRYLPSVNRGTDESWSESRYYVYDYQGTNVEEAKDTYNYSEYGVLYNYIAAQTACPAGWHLPSDSEWTELEIYLENNGYNFDGYIDTDNDRETHNMIAKSLASTYNWSVSEIENTPGWLQRKNNSSGFNGKPAGWKTLNGQFAYINENGTWWSSTPYNGHHWDRYIHYTRIYLTRSHNENHIGMSIRCIQD